MQTHKKPKALALLLVLGLVLAACAGEEGTDTTSAGGDTATTVEGDTGTTGWRRR